MSLFKPNAVIPPIDYDPCLFYTHDRGVVYPVVPVAAKEELFVGKNIPLTGMLDMFELLRDKTRIGFIFRSSFSLVNHGGALLVFLQNRGLATEHEVVTKIDDLIIYNYPNKGTLAVSPRASSSLKKILEAQ